MRLVFTLIVILFSSPLFAQKINGLVFDKLTKQPVANANATLGLFRVSTTNTGAFMLNNVQPGDRIKISCIGYETYQVNVGLNIPDPLVIWLVRANITLQELNIKGTRNYRRDSLQTRKEFKSVFNYKAPSFKDMLVARPKHNYFPKPNNRDVNSTSSVVSLNLMPLVSLLSSKKSPIAKLQQRLIKNEELNYVDQVFSRQKIVSLTNLKADSLDRFMDQYRPTIAEAKSMSSYQVLTYIKKSYVEFTKP